MTRKQRRLTLIGSSMAVLGMAAALVLVGLRDSIVFFYTPSALAQKEVRPSSRVRMGGIVQPGSLARTDGASTFSISDANTSVPVVYRGILPDLFREGQGVVSEGMIDANGVLRADTVLAKHDENYMPREVAEALKSQGHWKGSDVEGGGASPSLPSSTSPSGAFRD